MKFLLGVVVGAAFMRFYGSEQGAGARQQLEHIPDRMAGAGQIAAASISTGAERVYEMVDAAPIPEPIKAAAGEAAFNTWAAAESVAGEKSAYVPDKPTEPVKGV